MMFHAALFTIHFDFIAIHRYSLTKWSPQP